MRRRDRRRRLHRTFGGARAGTPRRLGGRARSRRARRGRGFGPQRRPRQQRARGRLCRRRGQGGRRAGARLVSRLRRGGRRGRAHRARRDDRLRLHAPRQVQARDPPAADGRAGAQRRTAGARRRRHRRRDPRCGRVRGEVAERALSSAGCSTSAAARCTSAASRPGWPQRPSATARGSTSAPACSACSGSVAARRIASHTARGALAREAGAARQRRRPARQLWQLRLAAPPHRADRQLHRRHRAAGPRAREGAASRAPHLCDGRQHPPLLPPDAGPPAGVRRARPLQRQSSPVVGRQRAATILRAGMVRDLPVSSPASASTTAGAASST